MVIAIHVLPLDSRCFFFLMIRRPPRSTLDRSSAASDVYKRQGQRRALSLKAVDVVSVVRDVVESSGALIAAAHALSLIHISEPTRPY